MKLTIKQQRFVDFYDGNATEAMIKAGYEPKYAATNSTKLLKNTKIREAIQKRELKRNGKHIATREERQIFWTKVLNGDEKDLILIGDSNLEITPKMRDRLKASELLGRSQADFADEAKGDKIIINIYPPDVRKPPPKNITPERKRIGST